jgi:predicted dienelactone hydrolase
MRPLEIALLLGGVFAFALLAVPRLRATRWPLYAAAVVALLAVVQVAVEGARWQIIPSYALAGILLIAALLPRRGFVQIATLGAALVALLVSIALPIAVPLFSFPAPTGPYAIGTLTYHWTDETRPDLSDPAAPRELMAQVWYPATVPPDPHYDSYIQDSMNFAPLPGGLPFPGFFFNHLKDVRTHAMRAAPVASGTERFPVLIFSPGGQGFRQHNTFEVEELVSHGYIVAAIDHPGAAREVVFPDGRRAEFDPVKVDVPGFLADPAKGTDLFHYLAADVSFALDQLTAVDASDPNAVLTGRLDTGRFGMFGVSLGGLVTAEACHLDPRLKACLIEDVFVPRDVIDAGLAQPAMWITRDATTMRAEGWTGHVIALHRDTMRAAYQGARSNAYFVEIPGAFHLNFTDLPYTVATPIARQLGLIGPTDWTRAHTIINAYATAFFDRHLKQQQAALLDGPSESFPEIGIESRR